MRVTRPLRAGCWKDSNLSFGDVVLSVFVLDRQGVAVMPCTQKRARLLLARGRARVHRLVPFVIRLVDVKAEDCSLQPLSLKIDPGSKTTGMALVRDVQKLDICTGEISKGAVVLSLVSKSDADANELACSIGRQLLGGVTINLQSIDTNSFLASVFWRHGLDSMSRADFYLGVIDHERRKNRHF